MRVKVTGGMEELLVYAILFYEGLMAEGEYYQQLNKLFLQSPQDGDLMYLEWETDIQKAVVYIRTHANCQRLDQEQFGRVLINCLKKAYNSCTDMNSFAGRMYDLWKNLPETLQRVEPFFTLCYADDPLSWGDEEQTRAIYEDMLAYYQEPL